MYLKKVVLQDFRSFSRTEVELCPDLTVFIGENNGGKSNVIDAIRLLTQPLSGRPEIYCEDTDIRFGSGSRRFELQAQLTDLSPGQQGRLLSAISDMSMEDATFGCAYELASEKSTSKQTWWAGHLKGVPEAGCLGTIRHVYLPPLRDARRELSSASSARVYRVLQYFLSQEEHGKVAEAMARQDPTGVLRQVGEAIDKPLSDLTIGVRRQGASLGFSKNERLIDIARELRFTLADYGIEPEDLRYSGHGYANLLYMSVIAIELERVETSELTIFLVEEPEAHLHPQLQAAVLGFLEDQAAKSRRRGPMEGPSGEIQVVVASHSPNLSAWVNSSKLVVFKSSHETKITPIKESLQPVQDPSAQAPTTSDAVEFEVNEVLRTARRVSRCVSLNALDLDPKDRRKIDRYLDVTKSAMLFGGRVLLVEGIAEALLIPALARRFVLQDRRDDFKVFRSVVFVPIEGVDFEPYVRLLLTPTPDGVRIADRLVVVTDGDARDTGDESRRTGEGRRRHLEGLAADLKASEQFCAITNSSTLEPELVNAGNADLMRAVYLKLHPKSSAKWDAAVSRNDLERTREIQDLFASTRKGDFAQSLAEHIVNETAFSTPRYLVQAIEEIVR